MLVSPAEPATLREPFTVSALPERYGADFLFIANRQWVGIQRKEIKDFLASLYDGRLAKELAQLQSIPYRVLVIEGNISWTNDGFMLHGSDYGRKVSRKQWKGLLWSVRAKGVWVEFSDNWIDTLGILGWLEEWFKKSKHNSLDTRPGPDSLWGKPSNRDYQKHLIMGLPGVGVELAERIIDKFGMPFTWKISKEDLLCIDGIGVKKAEAIWMALEMAEVT